MGGEAGTRRLLYVAYGISQIGNWAFRIGILIGLLQSSKGAVGIGVAVIFAPIVVGSLFLSPLVDRSDQLITMIAIDLARALAMVPLLVTVSPNAALIYAVVAGLSLTHPIFLSAQVSFLRSIVRADDMVTALRNLSNIDWATYVFGMAGGAIIVSRFSLDDILAFNALTFIASALILAMVRSQTPHRRRHPSGATGSIDGTLADLSPLRWSFSAVFLLNLGAGIINVYPAVTASASGEFNQAALSALVVANGVAGLLGALSVRKIYRTIGPLKAMTAAAAVVGTALFAMSGPFGILCSIVASSLMLGAGQVFAVSAQTHMVSSVPKDRAGKLAGIFQCCTYGGIAANGLLFSAVSPRASFALVVASCGVSALAACAITLKGQAWTKTRVTSTVRSGID